MGSKGGGASQREATEQEKQLWESQSKNLDSLTKIAEIDIFLFFPHFKISNTHNFP